VWVENEVTLAQEIGKRIYPILIEGNVRSAVPLRLINVQRVDGRQELGEAVGRVVAQMGLQPVPPPIKPVPPPVDPEQAEEVHSEKRRAMLVILGLIGIVFVVVLGANGRLPTATPVPPTATPFSSSDRVDELLIPAGEFVMGSPDGEGADDERPQHTVYLDAYYIDKYEVTNARYQACVDAGACDAPQESSSSTRGSYFGNPEYADYPVVKVTWFQAEAFCAWEGRRLPTEAEWEKAARGTDGRKYPWGNEPPTMELCNFNNNVDDTTPVGQYPKGASPYGVMDMAGNVWEWVNDWYGEDYYSQSPSANPPGPETGEYRVVRGGSWDYGDLVSGVRSAFRGYVNPDLWGNVSGFRCVRSQ
jgi:formylglycine-generating enzyme required for sulfatase activity